ncbi:unnamed protein product [Closterium sp. Naga37s-1]|nr:unnamed protein product [Closterium sp. Naga37s-1]
MCMVRSLMFDAACPFPVSQAWQMPLQQNDVDCGIFVCQYIHALVEACFEGAEIGVRFSMSPLAYRRGLREDVCALAEGRLIGELTAAGHEIPPGNEISKPHEAEVIGDEVEDKEWRAEMAERMHRLEVRNEGQAVAIAKLEWTETTSRNNARGRALSSGYTGVSKRENKWAAKLCVDGPRGKFLALGRYTDILEAATAYAAAAHICRPSLSGSKMVELNEEDRRCLEGLTSKGVERIVDAKRWPEWRNWRAVLSSLPEPSTPAATGVHTQAPPPFSHQHPGATFGYHQPAAAFAGHAGATPNQGHTAAQNTAPYPHVLPTPPAVAPSTAQQGTDPHAHQVPPSEENAQARVAGMTDSQHNLSMPTAPNDPNPPSHGSALASEPAAGEMC